MLKEVGEAGKKVGGAARLRSAQCRRQTEQVGGGGVRKYLTNGCFWCVILPNSPAELSVGPCRSVAK